MSGADWPHDASDAEHRSSSGLGEVLDRTAGTPPVRIEPSAVRAAEARRRRRTVAVAAAGALLVAAAAAGVGRALLGPGTVAEQPARPTDSPEATWTSISWNGLQWDVPSTWAVADSDAPPNAAGPSFFSDGPAFGTLQMGPMCRSTGAGVRTCSRANLVTAWPADGVVAWVAAADVGDPKQSPRIGPTTTADPGPFLAGLDCTGHGGSAFHAYRLLGVGSPEPRRVTLNGCAIGPHVATYTAHLLRSMSTLTLATHPSS